MGWFSLDGDNEACCCLFAIPMGVTLIGGVQMAAACVTLIVGVYYDHVAFFTYLLCCQFLYSYFFLASRINPKERDT